MSYSPYLGFPGPIEGESGSPKRSSRKNKVTSPTLSWIFLSHIQNELMCSIFEIKKLERIMEVLNSPLHLAAPKTHRKPVFGQ